jgi:L-seryl-tRNA(Ser) seleniumtransferase
MADKNQALLRKIPSVDTLLQSDPLKNLADKCPHKILADAARLAAENIRQIILEAKETKLDETDIHQTIIEDILENINNSLSSHYCKVVNATGIILHTALGRAILSKEALQQIQTELTGYSLLQADVETGKRSARDAHIEKLFQLLTGCQAATVVNNNAAATAIVLNTIAKDKEVIVSRGQLVEIGGSFRLPDVMAFSGAKLIEVGTTNKTHPRDYENAITENTAAILRVHPSNYKIQGFTSEVPLDELVDIAHANNLIMFDDVGAGSLIDFSKFGFEPEPTLIDSVKKGADVITSSADKLIGASQAGIILGKTDIINAIRKNQFARIVRVGKLTLAVLEATLKLFFDETIALSRVPTLKMMLPKPQDISKKAKKISSGLKKILPSTHIETIAGFSQTGSGSLPAQNLPTTLISVSTGQYSAQDLAQKLRKYQTPVFTRIQNDKVLIDPRTLQDGDEKILTQALTDILKAGD